MSAIPTGIWRANCVPTAADGKNVEYNNYWLVGDAFGEKIGYLDEDTMQEFAGEMGCWLQTGIIHQDRDWISIADIELDMETGVGTATVTSPTIDMEKSEDAGATFSTAQSRGLGASGAKGTRVRWNRVGASRQTIFRFTITDAVKRVFLAMHGTFWGRRR